MTETSKPNPKQLLGTMLEQRYLNKFIFRQMFDSKVMILGRYDRDNPALIIHWRKLNGSGSPGIKYRGLPFLTIKKETVKTYNKPGTIMKEKYLYLNFNPNKDTIICEGEIDFLGFHDDIYEKYNVVAYPGVGFMKDLMIELIQTSRKNIIFLGDNDTPSKSAFYKAIVEVETLGKGNLKRIKYACGVLGNFKDINEFVCNQYMTLGIEDIERHIEGLGDTEVNKDSISKIFPHLSHYLKHLKKIDIPSLLELSTMDCDIGDRVVVITSINIGYSETNITHREGSGYIVYKYDGSTEPISLTNLEVTDVNHFKKKISTIKFIDLASMQKGDMVYIMNNLKRVIDYLEKKELVEIVKEYQSLGRINKNQFIFSNGTLDIATKKFMEGKNLSQLNKKLSINFPLGIESKPITEISECLRQYINSDYILFIISGYLFATIYLSEIREYTNSFPLLNLNGVKGVGKSFFTDLISTIVGHSENKQINLVSATEAGLKNTVASIKHIIFMDEYGTKNNKYGESNYIDEKLMANYDGHDIVQGDIASYGPTTRTLSNQSAIVYGGMRSTSSEALLSRSIVLNIEATSTHRISRETRMNIINQVQSSYFTQMMNKKDINIIELYNKTQTFINNSKLDFGDNHRLKNNFIVISMYWMLVGKSEWITKQGQYYITNSSFNFEMNSSAAAVINHISNNIEEYCSIQKCISENKIPSIYIRHQGDGLSINVKGIIATYKRLNIKDSNDIFENDLFNYFGGRGGIRQSYKEVIYINSRRKQQGFVEYGSIENDDVKELYENLRLHIISSIDKCRSISSEHEKHVVDRMKNNENAQPP